MADKTDMIEMNQRNEAKPFPAAAEQRLSLSNGFPGTAATGNTDTPFGRTFFSGGDVDIISSALPKVSHWSIAWSDLMMTMFILFLSLFVYQAAHQEFLVSDEREVIGGETVEAVEMADTGKHGFPFVPITPDRPLVSDETVKKVESIRLEEIEMDTAFFNEQRSGGIDRIMTSLASEPAKDGPVEKEEPVSSLSPAAVSSAEIPEQEGPARRPEAQPGHREGQTVTMDFSAEKENITKLGLDDFASVTLVPDQTMRIILTGDLLFDTGKADLNTSSISSLKKIAAVIKKSPYMINVIGHTDNIPMHSAKYATNWELSAARASTVARFLVEEMKMNPHQFVVSGYASFRPLKPNTNTRNRAINRRVEIIISKRLPAPVAANNQNIN
ncbi:MAG: hypothetical protein CR981_03955 [Proteobacteria bacterium]|nr:MAG: hypothetical protein CR981_03955 [Pseudomonadota bacterium]